MTEVFDTELASKALRRVTALGEYLILDDIADLGKLDHFHHYIVGLLMFLLGMGGELATKVAGLMGNFTSMLPQLAPPPPPALPEGIIVEAPKPLPYFMPGALTEEEKKQSAYERALKKVSYF